MNFRLTGFFNSFKAQLATAGAKVGTVTTKLMSSLVSRERSDWRVEASSVSTMTYGQKRKVSKPTFSVVHYDRRYNERLRLKAIEGNRRCLYRLKGKTVISWRGHEVVFDYPIFNEVEFGSFLSTVTRLEQLNNRSMVLLQESLWLEYLCIPYRKRCERDYIRSVDGETAVYDIHGSITVCELMNIVPLVRQQAGVMTVSSILFMFASFVVSALDLFGIFYNPFDFFPFNLVLPFCALWVVCKFNAYYDEYLANNVMPYVLLSAFLEEVHKRLFGMYLPAFESVSRLMVLLPTGDIRLIVLPLVTFWVHYLFWTMPFLVGVICHALTNVFVRTVLFPSASLEYDPRAFRHHDEVVNQIRSFNAQLIDGNESFIALVNRENDARHSLRSQLNLTSHRRNAFVIDYQNHYERNPTPDNVLEVTRGLSFAGWLRKKCCLTVGLENFAATVYDSHLLDISKIIQLIRFVVAGQYDHALHALVNFGYAKELAKFLDIEDSPSRVMDYFFSMFSTETETEAYLAHTPLRSFMERFLPTFVRKSPTYVAIVTLVSCIMSSSLFSKWSVLYDFLPLVDFAKLSPGDMIATAIESGWLVIKSAWDAVKSGNFREFFRRPKEYVQRVKIMEFLERKPRTVEEDKSLCSDIDSLIEDILLSNDPILLREVDKLTRKKKEFRETQIKFDACKMLSDLKTRVIIDPMVFDEMVNSLMLIGEHRMIADLYVAQSNVSNSRDSQVIMREAAIILGLLRVAGDVSEERVDAVLEKLSLIGESRLIVEIESARQKAVIVEGEKALSIMVSKWLTATPQTLQEYTTIIDEISLSLEKLIHHPQLLIRAKDIRDELIKRRNSSYKREPPIVVFLLGEPGTGKTTAMSQITKMWAKQCGVEYDPAIEGYLYTDQKHPAETISQDGQVMFLNDVTAEHSEDAKSDRVSLGEIFRSIMDSTPLCFPSAQVSRKGMNFWNLKLVFVTTNTRSFVFSEDAERLKRRFDEFAVIVDLEICENGKPVAYDVFSKWPLLKRNESTMVQMYRATCDAKRVAFKDCVTSRFVHVSYLYAYLYARFKMVPVLRERSAKLLKNTCDCGLLKASHFRDGEFISIVEGVCVPCEPDDVIKLPPLCKCGLDAFHKANPVYDCASKFTMGFVEMSMYATFLFIIWTHFERISNNFYVSLDAIRDTSREVLLSAKETKAAILLMFGLGDRLDHVADIAYCKFVRGLKKFTYLLAGGIGIYALVRLLMKDSSNYTQKIVVRENTDLRSLYVNSHRFEVNWPKETAERWNKEQKQIRVVQLDKVGVGSSDLEKKCQASTKKVDFYSKSDPKKVAHGYAFCIGPELCLMNRHYFYKDGGDDFDAKYVDMDGCLAEVDESCIQEIFHDGLKTDVLVVRSPKVDMSSDMLPFFSKELDSSQCYGTVVGIHSNVLVTFEVGANLPCLEGRVWRVEEKGELGQCGSPLVINTPRGSCIAGVVSFGASGHQGGNVITQCDIVEAIEKWALPIVHKTVVSYTLSETLTSLNPLDPKAEIRNVDTPYVVPIGSTSGGTMKFHSSMAPTHLYDFAEQRFSKPYDFPKRVRTVKDGKFVSAFSNTMSGIVDHGVISPKALSKAVKIFSNYFISNVEKECPGIRLSPATAEEAMFGCKELDMERSNFNSSLGPEDRHFRTRKDLFDERDGTFVAKDEFVKKIDEYIQQLKEGTMRAMHVSGSFKDEIRSKEKLDDMWVRLFCTIDHPSNFVSRMYLQPLVQLLLRYPQFSKCFGKMNSGSSEWDRLFRYLDKGDKWCDMDFKNFDISHSQAVIRAVAEFFFTLAEQYYRNDECSLICYLLVMSLAVQIFQFMLDYMIKYKGLPSGHILTLILNSIVNILLMMCAYEECGHDMETFFDNVFPAVVGDDNLSGLSSRVCETFNLRTVQPIYRRYGYRVTDAKKSAIVEPFVSKENAQFLKRGFRFEPLIGEYVAPIELDSVWKMLAFWTKKTGGTNATYVDRMVAVIDVAQRELFLHGKAVFDEHVAALRTKVESLGWSAKWYEWSELLGKLQHSRKVEAPNVKINCFAELNKNFDNSNFVENSGTIGEVNTSEQILNPAPSIDDSSIFVADDYDSFKGHEVVLGLGSWTKSTPAGTTVITNDLFRNYLQLASANQLGRKLRSFKYARGNLRCTIVVQGSTTAYGKRVISFDPVVMGRGLNRDVTIPPVGDTRSLLIPHIEIDPAKSATYYVDLPPPTIYGVYSMAQGDTAYIDQLGSYRVCSTVINPLSFGTNITPTISMVMYVSLVGAKLMGPSTAARYNWTSLEVEQKSADGGVISGLMSKAAEIASVASIVPSPISQPLNLFSSMSSSAAKFLTWFGFSKPIVQDTLYVVPGTGHNYTRVDNKVKAEQLSMRSNNSITITGHDIPLFKAEEMETEWLCKKKGLISVATVDTTAARDAVVWQLPVNPTDTQLIYGSNLDEAELTPLGFAALPYEQWRGDLVFTLEVVASVFSRCTLFVAWDPANSFPLTPTVTELSQVLKHWVIEVSGSTTTEIRIPWKQLSHMCNRYFPQYGVGTHVEPATDQCNGRLILMVLNPLVQNGSTDGIFINTYVHGENMKFGWPTLEASSDEYDVPYSMFPVIATGTIFTSATRDESNFFGKFFGEEHAHTVKELASRLTLHDAPITNESGTQITRRFAPYESSVIEPAPILTLLQFISLGYVGMRGSINSSWMIYPTSTTSSATTIFDLVKSHVDAVATSFIFPQSLWNGLSTLSGTANGVAVLNAPYYYNGLFKPSYTYYNTRDACTNAWIQSNGFVATMAGLGDDGVFVGFRGVPMLTFPGL